MAPATSKCEQHSGHESRLKALEESDKDQWEIIRRIQNRPPAWVTLVIGLLTFALGYAMNYAAMQKTLAEAAQSIRHESSINQP